MAKPRALSWRTFVIIDGEERMIAEGDGQGNVVRHMSPGELEPIENRIMEQIGKGMSLYCETHPDCGILNK